MNLYFINKFNGEKNLIVNFWFAETSEQGMRRLNRAYADSNIESTDKENLPKDQTVIEKITSSDASVILGRMRSKTNKKRNKRGMKTIIFAMMKFNIH